MKMSLSASNPRAMLVSVGLTDLAVSCKAAPAPTQPAGPGARRRPSTNGRAELTGNQDVTRAALSDATPS